MCDLKRLSSVTLFMASCAAPTVSASKLRRQRAQATKQRLFATAADGEPLKMIQSHLAMLTASLDIVVHYVISSQMFAASGSPICLNPSAPEFVLSGSVRSEAEHNCEGITGQSMDGVWEPMEPCWIQDAKEQEAAEDVVAAPLEQPDGFESSCVGTLETGSRVMLGHIVYESAADRGEFNDCSSPATTEREKVEKKVENAMGEIADHDDEKSTLELEWARLEEHLGSCLQVMQGSLANMAVPQDQRENVLDELSETGMASIQTSMKSSEGRLMLYRHFCRLHRTLRTRIADMIPE